MKRYKHLWHDVVEAISGTEQDFSSGRLGRAILLLSIPMVLEMVLESVFAVVDIFFVSGLGAKAVAIVGITESMMTIVYAIGLGLGTGTTAIISRRIGEKHPREACLAAGQSIIAGLVFSIVIALSGTFFAKDLLYLMGASSKAIAEGWKFTAIMMGGNVVIMLLFIINAVFRSSGDAAISMRVLWFANLINIFLDPILIYGWGPIPAFGVQGAAMATTTGRGLGVLFQFYLLFGKKHRIKLSLRDFIPYPEVMLRLIRLSLGGITQNLISTSSWVGLVRIVSSFGSEVVAGYTIAIRILIFTLLPAWGLSNAASTLVGQNLGAGKPKRAERSAWGTAVINMILMGITGTLIAITPHFYVGIFIKDAMVIAYGADALRIISYGYVFYALGMVMVQAINGAGDTYIPTFINFICFWLIEIPLAYFFAKTMNFKQEGVYYAIITAESMMAILGAVWFMLGKWKQKKV
jgi:putative MATE family efflux protein